MRTAQPLMEKLNDWQSQYVLRCKHTSSQEVDQTAPLQLASHYTRTLIIRALYRPFCILDKTSLVQASGSTSPEAEAYAHYRIAATSAVNKFTDFARKLTDRQIRAFWPFCESHEKCVKIEFVNLLISLGCTGAWATMCSLWLLLYATAKSNTERDRCKAGLDESRNLLRLRASSCSMFQFALLRVNSIFWKGLDDVFDTVGSI